MKELSKQLRKDLFSFLSWSLAVFGRNTMRLLLPLGITQFTCMTHNDNCVTHGSWPQWISNTSVIGCNDYYGDYKGAF